MSILKNIAVAGGLVAIFGAMAFAQQDDERARLEEEAFSMGVVKTKCDNVAYGGSDYVAMGCSVK